MTDTSSTPSTVQVTDALLREILAGCEGVTPGPWASSGDAVEWHRRQKPFADRGASIFYGDPNEGMTVVTGGLQDEQGGAVGVTSNIDADHIARLDPATVASICTLALEALERRSSASDVEALVKALPEAFITCNSDAPRYWVEIKTQTLKDAQRWHDAVLVLAREGSK